MKIEIKVRSREQFWLSLALCLSLVRGVLYTLVVPPWQHPDEPTHFEHVRIIAQMGQLPAANYVSLPIRREIATSMLAHNFWRGIPQPSLDDASLSIVGISPLGIYTLTQPRLYYVLAAIWLRPWLYFPVDIQLYIVRLLSVLLNLLVVAGAFYTVRILFPRSSDLAWGTLGFMIFHPVNTDIMSAVNNDALINAFGAGYFLTMARIYRFGLTWRSVLFTGLLLGGAVLTKTTSIALLAAFPLGVVLYPRQGKWARMTTIGLSLLGAAMVGLFIGLILGGVNHPFLRNLTTTLGQYFRIDVAGTLKAVVNPDRWALYYTTAIIVFRSFWAAFGWRHVLLSPEWYWLPGLAMVAAAVGLSWQGTRWLRQRGWAEGEAWRASYLLFALGVSLLAWAVAIIRSQAIQGMARPYHSHGRYIFVTLPPFALLFTLGVLSWLPQAWRQRGLAIYLVTLAAFDALCFWGYLVPYYYHF